MNRYDQAKKLLEKQMIQTPNKKILIWQRLWMIWKKAIRTNLLKNLKKIIQKVVAHNKEASLQKLNKLQDFSRKVASLSYKKSLMMLSQRSLWTKTARLTKFLKPSIKKRKNSLNFLRKQPYRFRGKLRKLFNGATEK